MSNHGACPTCGSHDIRVSDPRSLRERMLEWVGIYQLRCRACRLRYQGALWQPRNLIYARCPKCYRMELSTWSAQYYNPSVPTVLALRLGATPYRCEFCRCNFASWRACKERFGWRKYRKAGAARSTDTAASQGGDSTTGEAVDPDYFPSSNSR